MECQFDSSVDLISGGRYMRSVSPDFEFNFSPNQPHTQLMGRYLIVQPRDVMEVHISPELKEEFAIWDAATDFDLVNFKLDSE